MSHDRANLYCKCLRIYISCRLDYIFYAIDVFSNYLCDGMSVFTIRRSRSAFTGNSQCCIIYVQDSRPGKTKRYMRWCNVQYITGECGLTHLPLDKMAAISPTICIFVTEKCFILIKISLEFVPRYQIDNKTVLVQIMAWRRIGDKPLSEPIVTRFIDAYMRH